MSFSPTEAAACRRLIDLALEEDLGNSTDLTSAAILPADRQGHAEFISRAAGVVAGLPALELLWQAGRTPGIDFRSLVADGSPLEPGARIAVVSGPIALILTGERIALNFLQHLSGIASLTRRFVDAAAGLPCQILDTRKTIPGWRYLAKYAVRCGGGRNHRMGLYDAVLIKDNHLAALDGGERTIASAVELARKNLSKDTPIEIEVDTLDQLNQALSCAPDIVLLDNMPLDDLRQAVKQRNRCAPGVLLEASGGVTLATVRAIAETGVDRISVGAITHSAGALDIGLDYVR